MRKITAILLIGLLGFTQYIRPLSYLECQFSNLFKAETLKCDCEQKAGYEKPVSGEAPAPKNHTHLHLDEFFRLHKEIHIGSLFAVLRPDRNLSGAGEEAKGCGPAPWRPPNT